MAYDAWKVHFIEPIRMLGTGFAVCGAESVCALPTLAWVAKDSSFQRSAVVEHPLLDMRHSNFLISESSFGLDRVDGHFRLIGLDERASSCLRCVKNANTWNVKRG